MGQAKIRKANDPNWGKPHSSSPRDGSMPEVLYKFMSSKYADDLITGKSIRVGTLFDFRDQEQHGQLKGDADEGMITLTGPTDRSSILDTRLMAPAQRHLLGPTNKFVNVQVWSPSGRLVGVSTANCHVLCLSLECNPEVAAGLDTDYDCCVRIGNPAAFGRAIARGMAEKIGRHVNVRGGRVNYCPRHVPLTEPNPKNSPFHKGKKFSEQQEYRFVFEGGGSSPIIFPFNASGCAMSINWRRPIG